MKNLVREELEKRLARPNRGEHPALLEIHREPEIARPCVIEPDRPCYHSGYCKRLGY
ncbi:MAG: hypothetical protein ACRD21_00705 [Vicinamibacteria bacterium]